MVTAPKKWRRWCGPRSELVRAAELARDEIEVWTGVRSRIRVKSEDRSGLTETREGIAAITSIHADDLRRLASLVITIEADRDDWWRKVDADRTASRERGEEYSTPDIPSASVSVRITEYGTTLEIEGDERTPVEGLRQRLSHGLERGASNSLNREWIPGLTIPLWFLLTFGGIPLLTDLGLIASSPDRVATDEIVAIGVITAAVGALSWALWWLHPPIELLDDGAVGRTRRFRKWIVGAATAVVLGVIATLVYDQAK